MIYGTRIPATFWHLGDVEIPKDPWYNHSDDDFAELRSRFLTGLQELEREEESGIVQQSTVLNLLMAAWALKRDWHSSRDGDLLKRVGATREIAKKYGFTKMWDAAYYSTFLDRLGQKCDDDRPRSQIHHCGRCGREIWNKLSVKRGKGPVCWGKHA